MNLPDARQCTECPRRLARIQARFVALNLVFSSRNLNLRTHSTLDQTYLTSSCNLSNELIVTCIVRGQGNSIDQGGKNTSPHDTSLACIVSGLKSHRKRRESGVLVHLLLIPTPVLVRVHYHLMNLMVSSVEAVVHLICECTKRRMS